MHRKITRTGPATLTIAIPAKWAKKHNLEPGKEIRIDEIENNLVLSIEREKIGEVKRIPYNSLLIENMLENLYKQNTSKIVIYSDEKIPQSIYKLIEKFPGLKILDETNTKIVISQILEPTISSPKALLRRAYILLINSFENNPPILRDLDEILSLLSLQNLNMLEWEKLKMLNSTLKTINMPIYDELYAYPHTIIKLLYKQKYKFKKNDAEKLIKLFEQSTNFFDSFYKKESTIKVGKIFHCVELCKALHNIILTEKSIDILQQVEKQTTKEFVVGVCLKNTSNKFWNQYVQGSMIETQEMYDNIHFIYDSPFTYPDLRAQEEIVTNYIKRGVDLIILAPNHPSKLDDLVQKIVNAEIKLIIIDTEIESQAKHYYIGWDNYKGGMLTAKILNEKLSNQSEILIVEGDIEGNFHERVTGFSDNFNGKISIIQADFQQSVAYKKTLFFLKNNRVDAIYATSDNMAFGVLQATEELKINIPICGYDGTDEAKKFIKDNKMLSTIDDKPQILGTLAIESANKLLMGKQLSRKVIYDVELIK